MNTLAKTKSSGIFIVELLAVIAFLLELRAAFLKQLGAHCPVYRRK